MNSGIETAPSTSVSKSRKGRLRRVRKVVRLLRTRDYRRALRHGVAATVEHDAVPFGHSFRTVVDVGAHHGQFAVFAAHRFPHARLICVEPLPAARVRLERVLPEGARLLAVAADDRAGTRDLHVSRHSDSSSLLPIMSSYTTAFPGTEEAAILAVPTARLDDVIDVASVQRPTLLKIDVQGSELQVLRGADRLLPAVDEIFVECSFVEFYAGQALIGAVVREVVERDFVLTGVYSVVRDAGGRCLQADLLFAQAGRHGG